jgi:hypothetical protein
MANVAKQPFAKYPKPPMSHHQDELDALLRRISTLSDKSLTQLSQYISFLKWQESQQHSSKPRDPASTPQITWIYDFIEHYAQARQTATANPTGMELKTAPASCEGVIRPAIWQHPPAKGEAVLEYQIAIPMQADTLKLKLAAGVRDGALLSAENQVAFRIRVNGRLLWTHLKQETTWDDFVLDLPTLAGQMAVIQLITDALGNSRWNWAVWGEPQLLGMHL